MAGSKKVTSEKQAEKKEVINKVHENFNAMKPVIFFEYIFGIFRFHVKNGELKTPTWGMKLYSALLLGLYLTGFGYALRLPTNYEEENTLIQFIDQIPSVVMLFHYMMTMITTSYFYSKTNLNIAALFAELDDELIKTRDYYQKSRTRNMQYLIFWCVLISCIIILDICTQEQTQIEYVIFIVYVIEKLEIATFCIIIEMVKYRLTLINGNISHFLENKDVDKNALFTLSSSTSRSKSSMIGRPSERNWKIRDLALMYDKLGTLCSLFNEVFNFQIFMTLVSTFIYIIITIWTSLFYYRSPENNSGPLFSISIWCVTTILTVAGMCFTCERLRLVRNTTKILVNQVIMDYDLPKTMRMQAKAFMELIEAWPLRILVYDMFSVDITLMLKFISVATTYLIVIIQISHFTT